MGCNCSNGSVPSNYEVKLNSGEVKTFTTEADARMAVARNGGTWRAVPRT
jgi:hypothetical protein